MVTGNKKHTVAREEMVDNQIAARGLEGPKILAAFRDVPRHKFVPEGQRKYAYADHPLHIGKRQTISQPYIVAYMTEKLGLAPSDKVLEVGTGSGYQAAILAELVDHVYTVEIIEDLGIKAKNILTKLGYNNIHFRIGNGMEGWAEEAPFDKIILTAAAKSIPGTLLAQLNAPGKLIAPVGEWLQYLILYEKDNQGKITTKKLLCVRFVPVTG